MLKLVLSFFLFSTFVFGESIKNIESKISSNKKQYQSVKRKKSTLDKSLSKLAQKINKEEKNYQEIMRILDSTNTQLFLNKVKLSSSKNKINALAKKSKKLQENKERTEKAVVDFAVERYALSMGIDQADKSSLDDIIGKEVYTLVFDNVKTEIMDLNIQYLKINKNIRENKKKITELNNYIQQQNAIKMKYKNLVKLHEKTLSSLESQHKEYQKQLQRAVDKQNKISNLLGNLNILKKEEIKKEQQRKKKLAELEKKKRLAAQKRAKAQAKKALAKSKKRVKLVEPKATKELAFQRKNLDEDIDIEVRKIGSSVKGIKISKYRGKKTIAPLKSYKVVKKFGKYYDKVYKMQLFNESVALKTKTPNAKVFSIFKGQVVYAKQNSGLLENVVIVKHNNSLHTIYSHLDKIAPTLKVGKWIPKGYVVGRVNDTLEFQATKNSRYIDPLKLIK